MAKLPSVSYRKVIKAFQRLGWEQDRQSSSHIILVKEGHNATLSIPSDNP